MGTLIDSSVLIAGERGRLDLKALLAGYAEEDFAISAITASELLHGVHRAKTPSQRSQREAFVEGLLAQLPVIPFDLLTARIHARLSAELAAKRVVIGPHDLMQVLERGLGGRCGVGLPFLDNLHKDQKEGI